MTNLPTVKQLTYLCELADQGHFGRAAKACFISQSALSTAIHDLEANLGVTLFERGSKILLTPVGEKLVAQAREILNQLGHFVEQAKQAQGLFQTDLKLGVIPTIAPFLLPKILKPIYQQFANSKLFIREDLSPNLLTLLAEGKLDVLLFALPYDTTRFVRQMLFDDELVLCLPKGHQLSKQQVIKINDLKQQEILLLEDGHCLKDQTLKACRLDSDNLSIPYQATSLNTLVQMVDSQIGITLLPKMAVNANITHDTDTQIRLLDSKRKIHRSIALVWRKNSPREQEFKQLGEIIVEHYQV